MGADWAETDLDIPIEPVTLHNPMATFTTRGCPRSCPFCAVSRIEGGFREIVDFRPAPVVCDNNLLECSSSHLRRVVDGLARFPVVDFNQGLDARLFTPTIAREIARLKSVKIRFSLDHSDLIGTVHAAVLFARAAGFKDIGVYVLIGYKDTPDDARHRLETVQGWGIRPNPMRYQPLDAIEKNSHVADGVDRQRTSEDDEILFEAPIL